MLLGLDHLVIAVTDPDAAAAELEQRVGLACTGGGRHPSWGTYNRLAWFGDTYAELIGVFDPALTSTGTVSRVVAAALDGGTSGLATYALASSDLAGDLVRLRSSGSDLSDIEIRSRTRPDGEVVRWSATFPGELDAAGPPFVIEHELAGAEWGPAVRAERAAFVHPAGGPATVATLTLPVPDPAATAGLYRRVLGLAFEGNPLQARIGDQHVRLVAGTPLVDPAIVDLRFEDGVRFDVEAVGVRWRAA